MSTMAAGTSRALRRTVQVGALGLAALFFGSPSGANAAAPAGRWIYLRGGALPTPDEPVVEVLAVGDVMTGRGLADTPDLFAGVSDVLQSADLTIGNLEGAITARRVADASLWLLLPLSTPASLAEAGFDLLGVANNHALDNGRPGLDETRRLLRAEGLEPVDTQAVVRELGGLRVAFLAWNDLGSPDQDPLLAAVRQARADADVVILMVHWGREYQRHASLPQRELADDLMEAGADVVVGAHPHVVQELQVIQPESGSHRARLVAYSLGNFAFDQGWGDTGQGLGLRLLFDAGGLRAAQALPVSTAPRPRWMNTDAATDLLARITSPERLGFICIEESCELADVPGDSQTGIFTSGAVDLTGDGVPEIVQRRGSSIEVFQDDQSVWRSPTDWQVRDAALGDPDRDGRFEALLAVARADGASQPFIIGYRGGRYHDLWGGSPVSDPVIEVELADLDGDGLDELAAIEVSDDTRYLTVWRWHGWGFSLIWRSPPGEYRELAVLPSDGEQPARLTVSVQ